MRQLLLLASGVAMGGALSFAAHPAPNPALMRVKAVYVLPMGYALDQFLASNLTQLGVFKVVTDPQKADAVFTDRLDATFRQRMAELYPAPKAAVSEPPRADITTTSDENTKKSSPADKAEAERLSHESSAPRPTTFNLKRGTIFLVDRQSGNVIWSTFEHSKNTSSSDLDEAAYKIVSHLQNDMYPKPKVWIDANAGQ